jgi:hypothetical protein
MSTINVNAERRGGNGLINKVFGSNDANANGYAATWETVKSRSIISPTHGRISLAGFAMEDRNGIQKVTVTVNGKKGFAYFV